jgi:hypothetical protein
VRTRPGIGTDAALLRGAPGVTARGVEELDPRGRRLRAALAAVLVPNARGGER